jgi:hypothetical protein
MEANNQPTDPLDDLKDGLYSIRHEGSVQTTVCQRVVGVFIAKDKERTPLLCSAIWETRPVASLTNFKATAIKTILSTILMKNTKHKEEEPDQEDNEDDPSLYRS